LFSADAYIGTAETARIWPEKKYEIARKFF